jgi:hypothetical protein
MKKFIVELSLPGTGKLRSAELKAFAAKSQLVINSMAVPHHWIQTYVTDKKLYCIHIAPDSETVMEYGRQAGFPIDKIAEVMSIMDPTTSAMVVERKPRSVFE